MTRYTKHPPAGPSWRWLFVIALVLLVLLIVGRAYAAPAGPSRMAAMQARAKPIICKVFGRDCRDALAVAWCESRWYIWAVNGQYRGLFQMGSWERRRFRHAPGAWAQARAARRYFIASGRDWSPWSCRP